MTEKEYRSHPAISRSELWRIHESPEKFKWYKDHPQPATPSLLFGQVVHKLLLEPDTFDTEFAISPDVDRRTKAGREEYARFCEENFGKTVVETADYSKAFDMVAKVRNTPIAAELLDGQHELPLFWTDEDTGEECKCRLDCLTETDSGLVIVDYKTASDARTDVFNGSIYKYGYFFQAAMYSEGAMNALNLTERPQFVFIVQEKTPPYSINVVSITEDVMLYGLDTFRELLGVYHSCKLTDYWFGYNGVFDEVNESYLPGYLQIGEDDGE